MSRRATAGRRESPEPGSVRPEPMPISSTNQVSSPSVGIARRAPEVTTRGPSPASGMADPQADRHGHQRGQGDRQRRVAEVLDQSMRDTVVANPIAPWSVSQVAVSPATPAERLMPWPPTSTASAGGRAGRGSVEDDSEQHRADDTGHDLGGEVRRKPSVNSEPETAHSHECADADQADGAEARHPRLRQGGRVRPAATRPATAASCRISGGRGGVEHRRRHRRRRRPTAVRTSNATA